MVTADSSDTKALPSRPAGGPAGRCLPSRSDCCQCWGIRLAPHAARMIIDIHGHYTTEPPALHAFRDKQLAGLADPARRPSSTDLGISDEALVKSVEPQLRLQK